MITLLKQRQRPPVPTPRILLELRLMMLLCQLLCPLYLALEGVRGLQRPSMWGPVASFGVGFQLSQESGRWARLLLCKLSARSLQC